MYPTQNYPVCQMPCTCANPYAQPQVNAVKIDINNPQAYGGTNSQGQVNPVAPAAMSPYNYPYNSMYNMPVVQQYNTPGAYPQPPMVVQPQQNIQQNTMVTPPYNPNFVQQMAPFMPPQQTTNVNLPQNPAPAPMSPVPPVPVVPAPVMVVPPGAQNTQTPTINAPVTQTVNVNPGTVPPAVVDVNQTTTPNNAKPVEPVQPVQPQQSTGVDVNGILTALTSANTDDQTAAIQRIAEIAQTNPVASKALLNEQVFGQLVNIINADTSKLEGPKGTPDPKNLSPLEKAEINKQFAVYTLAILQKNFREEINKEMKKNNLPDIAINDIPYIKEGIVNNLKDNPNPTIREACLSALNYMGKPEDKEVLRVLYDISSKHDVSPAVQATAKDYLAKLPA